MERSAHRTRRPLLLVIEPDFMVRRTIALVARDLDIADVHETSGSDAAASLLATASYDGVLVCIDDRGYALIEQLRSGRTLCSARTPLAVTMSSCGVERWCPQRCVHLNDTSCQETRRMISKR